MKFKAEIDVMPHDALLDPQGKAVTNSMKNIGLAEIDGVRIGKHIRLFVEADSKDVQAASLPQSRYTHPQRELCAC